MTLSTSLVLVFLAFCAILAAVLGFCLRARRRQASSLSTLSREAMAAEDGRVLTILLSSMVAGALLALLTAYLVFIRDWQ